MKKPGIMTKGLLIVPVLTVFLLMQGCSGAEKSPESDSYTFPAEPPEINMPADPVPGEPIEVVENRKIGYTESIENYRFIDCEISFKGKDIRIGSCEFINSIVYVDDSENILIENSVIRDLNRYEETALRLYNSVNITVRGCLFKDNYTGLGAGRCSAIISENRFTGNNGHNALVIGDGSGVEVAKNYFYGSYPHAILVLNRESVPPTAVNIHHNIIDRTGEDAINFEDFRNGGESSISSNVITNTGWSAVLVEYNSWESNITIEGNWINGTGIDWSLPLHPLNPEKFQKGWGHGILIEDSSRVSVLGNRIIEAAENGIEITNGRDIFVKSNGISCIMAGIGVHSYNEASLYRGFSPLEPENAGDSSVKASDNVIFEAKNDYEVDENSELSIPGN